MPFIDMNTNVKLSKDQILDLKAEAGRCIAIIPGKSEAGLMVKISGEQDMFFQGEDKPCMMVQVSCFGQAPKADLDPFVEELIAAIVKITEIPVANIYLTITGFGNWGVKGKYL